MEGFPLEIILVFSGLALLMLGAALEDLKNYIIKKAHKGGKRKDMQIFKKALHSEEEKLGKAVMSVIERLCKENKTLKNANAYLQDDNCQLVHQLSTLKKKHEELQSEYNSLEKDYKKLQKELADAYHANGQLKRKYEGKCAGTVKDDMSIFTTKTHVKAGEKNA